MDTKELIAKVKQKKELRGLPDNFIEEVIKEQIKNKGIQYHLLSKKEEKQLIKEVRAKLRIYVGQFHKPKSRHRFLEKDKIEELLKTHSSTKERLPHYPILKKIISNLKSSSILDLGCGLNPIAIANSETEYYAYDINESDIEIINLFFERYKIKGKAYVQDIRKIEHFPKTDLCLLLKVIDVIENKGHKLAEIILKKLECRHVIVSFSTKTLSGVPMRHPQRGWIERLCSRLGYKYNLVKTKNELFYIIEKS